MKIKFIIFAVLIFFVKNLYAQNADIVISGNERYDKQTIIVYGEVVPKKIYSKNDVNSILKKLYSTNFFENVQITFENNILNIKVKEYPIISVLILKVKKQINLKNFSWKEFPQKKKVHSFRMFWKKIFRM